MIMLLFLGLGGHNLFRFNWVWYGGFLVLAKFVLDQRIAAERPSFLGSDWPWLNAHRSLIRTALSIGWRTALDTHAAFNRAFLAPLWAAWSSQPLLAALQALGPVTVRFARNGRGSPVGSRAVPPTARRGNNPFLSGADAGGGDPGRTRFAGGMISPACLS